MIQIPLRNRDREIVAYAVIDDCDRALVEFRWGRDKNGYVVRYSMRKAIWLHREITQCPAGFEADHIDGDPLNNTRTNLRIVTHAQQMQNLAKFRRPTTSKYRGVSWHAASGMWRAQVQVAGVCHNLGYFHDEDEAGGVASAFRLEHMTHTNETRKVR